MRKYIIIIALSIIFIANFSPISVLLTESYNYSNYNNGFQFSEESGGQDLKMAKKKYKWYLEEHPSEAKVDSNLYRTFTLKPWRFWQWRDLLFNPGRFSLPYKDPSTFR